MDIYRPTFLYIKQHKITGLMYFGKTIQTNPIKYKGSGIYWTRHLRKHGSEHVETLWYCLFLDKETLVNFAQNFSIQHDIENSSNWANLVRENGVTGGATRTGAVITDEHRAKQSRSMTGKKQPASSVESRRLKQLGKIRGPNKNKTIYPTRVCPHCGKSGSGPAMTKWHFDNCRK